MGKVVNYAYNKYQRFCQIKLDNAQRVLISVTTVVNPGVTVIKLCFFGLFPSKTIWEYNPTMAGGYGAYVRKMMMMFQDPLGNEPKHPLDSLIDRILPCTSISEVKKSLLEAERSLSEQNVSACQG